MRRNLGVVASAVTLFMLLGSSVAAQTSGDENANRRANSTFLGDTGLWFVPTAEILPDGKWSTTGQRVNFDRQEGITDIQHYLGTFAYGVADRVELFGSFRFITRIDRDARPIFSSTATPTGGPAHEFPLVTGQFTGSQVGDVVLGGKINLLTEANLSPVAVAVRGLVKLPTGDTDAGTSTGRTDGAIDLIVSKDFGALELSAFSGFMVRGSPDNVELPNGVRWGVGTGIPLGRAVTLFGEVKSETLLDDQLTLMGPLLGSDGTHSALITPVKSPVDMTVGLQWNAPRGFYVGAGLNYAAVHDDRVTAGRVSKWGDRLGLLFRLGYHPGVKAYAPPPPPPPPPPPAPDNRPPTVTLTCDPCELLFGEDSRLRADANDPDGDPLEYRWSAPTGEFQDPPNREVRRWRAPNQEGPVPITVTVSDGRGGSASDTVTVIVNAPPLPPAREYVFEDVHFDFDRFTLRVGAARVLDEVVAAMEADPNLRIEIEGHTCNIGTAEYNLALGERRANSVEEYLTSRNIGGNRLQTVSYGEERPQHDNTREETRRLNRRAALVVRVVQ